MIICLYSRFYRVLDYSRQQVAQNSKIVETIYTPMFRRSLFTIGILMRYFDFKASWVIGMYFLHVTRQVKYIISVEIAELLE